MPSLTLLDMTKDILSEMDSDDVNSINDTVESYQVARIIKNSFYEMIVPKHHKYYDKIFQLDGVGDSAKPTYMKLPTDVVTVEWIKYNGTNIDYYTPDDFLTAADALTASNTVTTTDYDNFTFKVGTNKDPTYYTSFDDNYIVFNSYTLTDESTLQQVNSRIKANREPAFSITDTFEPDMPIQMFPQLLAEAKSTAFAHIKQMPSQKAEQRANRQRRRLSGQGRVNSGIVFPDYGR